MRGSLFFAIACSTLSLAADPIHGSNQQGRDLALALSRQAVEQAMAIDASTLAPSSPVTFDPEGARHQVLEAEVAPTEITTFLEEEALFTHQEREANRLHHHAIAHASEMIDAHHAPAHTNSSLDIPQFTERHCLIHTGPSTETLTRTLDVSVDYEPAITGTCKRCLGHAKLIECATKRKAKKIKKEQDERLRADPTILHYTVTLDEGGLLDKHGIYATWRHIDNASTCDCCHESDTCLKEEIWTESDTWVEDKSRLHALLASPDSTLISRRCLDQSPRIFHDREIIRPCWVEELTFAHASGDSSTTCPYLTDPACQLISRTCLHDEDGPCTLWDYLFYCYQDPSSSIPLTDMHMAHSEDETYEGNTSCAEVITKLSLFKELKDQMETSQAFHPDDLTFFPGKSFSCSKNIANNLLYDCCSSFDGLATTLLLTHCNAEELELRDRRQQGLCHYIGRHSEEFASIWVSSHINTFCCFHNVLARVVQEQGREQLGLDWGISESPNCRGLTQAEIARLDLTHLDLSELYQTIRGGYSSNSEKKIRAFEERLRQRISEERFKV